MKKAIVFVLVFLMAITAGFNVALADGEMVTTGKVNVREFPDINADIIGVVDMDTIVYPLNFVYTDDGRTWVHVIWNGEDGYISDKFLEWNEEEYVYVYTTSVPMITTGSVNMRVWATIDGPIFGTLSKGSRVDVYGFYPSEDGRVWAEIIINNPEYTFAYISTKYLDFVDEGIWPNLEGHMVVSGGNVNIRENASVESKSVGILYEGDTVEVSYYIPTTDGRIWAMLLEDGREIGFVSVKYLEPAE